jgi:hypothetical protein
MEYILFIYMYFNVVTTQEFNSQEACISASRELANYKGERERSLSIKKMFCLPKGKK